MGMGTFQFDHLPRLEAALERWGNPVSVDEFLDILREVNDPDFQQEAGEADGADSGSARDEAGRRR
jgi:hypothetical protein